MTLDEFETHGALIGASDWAEVDRRVGLARAAVAWMLKSHRSLRTCDVFGPGVTIDGWKRCESRVWPPLSFCGLARPLGAIEELVSLHRAFGDDVVTCGHDAWSPCAGSRRDP